MKETGLRALSSDEKLVLRKRVIRLIKKGEKKGVVGTDQAENLGSNKLNSNTA